MPFGFFPSCLSLWEGVGSPNPCLHELKDCLACLNLAWQCQISETKDAPRKMRSKINGTTSRLQDIVMPLPFYAFIHRGRLLPPCIPARRMEPMHAFRHLEMLVVCASTMLMLHQS